MADVRVVPFDVTDVHDADVGDVEWAGWPLFMHASPTSASRWGRLSRDVRHAQAALVDGDEVVGCVHSVPIRWSGEDADLPARGWDEAFVRAFDEHDAGIAPTALCALAVTIRLDRRGTGLAAVGVRALRHLAMRAGLGAVIACVRPNAKARYPLTPFDRYVRWTTDAGEPFDPWMRVHARAGARIAAPVADSMVIPGTVAQWESWTGMRFPDSGPYVVPEALAPVEIDVEADLGRYVEPNVWMVHDLR